MFIMDKILIVVLKLTIVDLSDDLTINHLHANSWAFDHAKLKEYEGWYSLSLDSQK